MTDRLELRQSKGRWSRPVIGPSVEPLLQARPAVQRKRRAMPVRIIALLLLITHLGYSLAATLAMDTQDTHSHEQDGGITTADSLARGHHCASPSDPDQSRQHQGHGGDAVDGGAGCDHSCHAAAHLLGAPSEYRMPTLAGGATAQSGRDPVWSSRNSNPLIRPPLPSV